MRQFKWIKSAKSGLFITKCLNFPKILAVEIWKIRFCAFSDMYICLQLRVREEERLESNFTSSKKVFRPEELIFNINSSRSLTNLLKLRHFAVKRPGFADFGLRTCCQIYFATQTAENLFRNNKLYASDPKRDFRSPQNLWRRFWAFSNTVKLQKCTPWWKSFRQL